MKSNHRIEYQWRKLKQVSFLSRQNYVCRDKHTFVATKDVFVATKMILVAAAANDNREHGGMAVSINRPRETGVTVGGDF